jgi:hypothetical protein
MLQSIDHVVIVVRDLAQTVADYERAGFTVTPGGEHLGGATHNALISFANGTYFELIAFREPDRPQDHRWWQRLRRGEGLVDYALLSDELEAEAAHARRSGLDPRGPVDGGRRRPDGERLAWRSFALGQGVGQTALPFVIQDVTSRALRVPGGPATQHRLPVTRVAGLSLVVRDLSHAAGELAALFGVAGEALESRAGAAAARRFAVGRQWLELVESGGAMSPAGQHLEAVGEGPFEVVLSGAGDAAPGSGQLVAGSLHGARIRIAT